MLKNSNEETSDQFERAIEYRLMNIEKAGGARTASRNAPFSEGLATGYRYALVLYRESRGNIRS